MVKVKVVSVQRIQRYRCQVQKKQYIDLDILGDMCWNGQLQYVKVYRHLNGILVGPETSTVFTCNSMVQLNKC